MFICLICGKELESNRGLSNHIIIHGIHIREYKKKFNLLCYCLKCNKEISCGNKTGYCNSCRDRTGENNPFFQKHHTKETIDDLKNKCSVAAKKLWEDDEYREKVITNMSKPRNEQFAMDQSKRALEWYKNNPEQRVIRSEIMKNTWESGNMVKSTYSCNFSKPEKELYKLLKTLNINFKEKYTLKIASSWFYPDIIDLNKKIIVEYYGDYWHCHPKKYDGDYNF